MKIKLVTLRIPGLPKEKPQSSTDLIFIANEEKTFTMPLEGLKLRVLEEIHVVDLMIEHVDNTTDLGREITDQEQIALNRLCPVINGVIPEAYLPERTDAIVYLSTYNDLPVVGLAAVIYLTEDDNKTYRWTGSRYAMLSDSVVIGTGPSNATDGLIGADAIFHTRVRSAHGVDASTIGLHNVDDTRDIDKPLSTAQANAINAKADLASGYIPNNQLPSWVDDILEYPTFSDLPAEGETGKLYFIVADNNSYRWSGTYYILTQNRIPIGLASGTALSGSYGLATAALIEDANDDVHDTIEPHLTATDNPHSVDTDDVGLGNVTDTKDEDLPISRDVSDVLATKFQLDSTGKIPSSRLPGWVDDFKEYPIIGDFPTTGESGVMYVDANSNEAYRWNGATYVAISKRLFLGVTSGTVMEGDKDTDFLKPDYITTGRSAVATYRPMSERLVREELAAVKLWGNGFRVDVSTGDLFHMDALSNSNPIAKDNSVPWKETTTYLDINLPNITGSKWWSNMNGHAVIGRVGTDRYDIDSITGVTTKTTNYWHDSLQDTTVQHHDQFYVHHDIDEPGGFWVHDVAGNTTRFPWPDWSTSGTIVSYGDGVCIQVQDTLHIYEGTDIFNPTNHTFISIYNSIGYIGAMIAAVGQNQVSFTTADYHTAVYNLQTGLWAENTNHSLTRSRSTMGPEIRGYLGFGINIDKATWSSSEAHYLRGEGDSEYLMKYNLDTDEVDSGGYVCGWHFYGPIYAQGYCVRAPNGDFIASLKNGLSCPDTTNKKGYSVHEDRIVTLDLSGVADGMPPVKYQSQTKAAKMPLRAGIVHWISDDLVVN